jgi:hypothetical protein
MRNSECDYELCEFTHATLSIVSESMGPDEISEVLSIVPTHSKVKGEMVKSIKVEKNGWYLSSENILSSTNMCDHIDWLLDRLKGKEDAIKKLQSDGCRIAIGSYWLSKTGRGGPILGTKQIKELAKFNIPIGWDVSFNKTNN